MSRSWLVGVSVRGIERSKPATGSRTEHTSGSPSCTVAADVHRITFMVGSVPEPSRQRGWHHAARAEMSGGDRCCSVGPSSYSRGSLERFIVLEGDGSGHVGAASAVGCSFDAGGDGSSV